MLPIVVREDQIRLFWFYLHASLRQGMQYQHRLYGEVSTFPATCRLEAYALAEELAQMNLPTVVSVNCDQYRVWVRLQASESFYWQNS